MHFKVKKLTSALLGSVLALSTAASSFSAVAPSLNANAADSNYARLLQYSLYFYDANMCGDVTGCGLNWRGNCHTNDEVPGGFHDAGDHVMFGLPQGYTAAALGLSYYEFADAYEQTGQADHIKMILNHFCTYFKKSTKLNGDNVSSFLYQKGEGTADHSYWGPPEQQGGNRRMYWTSNGASDIAANYASALALNYKNFGNAEDLKYAKALYNFSKQYNQCATEGPDTFYASSKCADEQAMAAGCLALATGDSGYKNDVKAVNSLGVYWAYGWNDANLGAAVMNGIVNKDWTAANKFLGEKCNGSGYLFMDKWGSARLNCSMQFMSLVATKEGAGNFTDWAQGQMNYILGENPSKTCFVTGYASNSAKNAHHRAASGYTSYEQFNMNGWDPNGDHMNPFCAYGPNAKPLIGALVGGPCNANGDYHDNMADYVCNEVAIDYNAGLVGAAAGLYHFKKTGTPDSTINGVTKIYSGGSQPVVTTTTTTQWQQPATTTTTTQWQQPATTTTTTTPQTNPGSGDGYSISPKKHVVYDQNADDKMIGFDWADFGLPSGAKITKVEVNISANGNIGKWEGAFGSSTTVAPDYWTMTDNMSATASGNSATITWNVPADTAAIIQTAYGGQLKFGTWWIDSGEFTVDSIKVYADGSSQPVVTTTTTRPTTTTTTTTTTTRTTTTTQPPVTTTTTTPHSQVNATVYGDVNLDGYVSVSDAVAILQYIANKDKYGLTAQQLANADVSGGNDGVTANDALTIQKVDAGVLKKSQLPVR